MKQVIHHLLSCLPWNSNKVEQPIAPQLIITLLAIALVAVSLLAGYFHAKYSTSQQLIDQYKVQSVRY